MPHLHRETRGAIASLRLDHGRANALDLELLLAVDEALRGEEESDSRAVVLTGTGAIFSAGVDLKRLVDGGAAYVADFLPALESTLGRLLRFSKPVVAAVNGHAIAGGCVLALACDWRVLARGEAVLGVPELKVGVPFPPAGFEILRTALAPDVLRRVVLSGSTPGAEEALELGLVDELVDPGELLERATAVAGELAAIPADSFAATKHLLRQPALDQLARHAGPATAEILAIWSDTSVLATVEDFVERTLR